MRLNEVGTFLVRLQRATNRVAKSAEPDDGSAVGALLRMAEEAGGLVITQQSEFDRVEGLLASALKDVEALRQDLDRISAEREAYGEELRQFAHEVKMRFEVLDQQAPEGWSVKPTQCDAYIWARRILAENEGNK